MDRLIQLYDAWGKKEKADQWRRERADLVLLIRSLRMDPTPAVSDAAPGFVRQALNGPDLPERIQEALCNFLRCSVDHLGVSLRAKPPGLVTLGLCGPRERS